MSTRLEALAIEAEHVALGLDIDEHTGMTLWRGERMDYSMAVCALQDIRDEHGPGLRQS